MKSALIPNPNVARVFQEEKNGALARTPILVSWAN